MLGMPMAFYHYSAFTAIELRSITGTWRHQIFLSCLHSISPTVSTLRRCCSKNGTGRCSLSPYHIISDEVDASAGSDSPIPARGMYAEHSGLSRSPCTSVHHHDTNIEAPRPSLIFWHPSLFLNSSLRCHKMVFEQFDDAIGTKVYHAIPTPPGAMQQLP